METKIRSRPSRRAVIDDYDRARAGNRPSNHSGPACPKRASGEAQEFEHLRPGEYDKR